MRIQLLHINLETDNVLCTLLEGGQVYTVHIDMVTGTMRCDCCLSRLGSFLCVFRCRHVCFVAVTLARATSSFFRTGLLSEAELQSVVHLTYQRKQAPSPLSLHDECFVCFERMCSQQKKKQEQAPALVRCPSCGVVCHRACAETWIGIREECMMCRSPVWQIYHEQTRLFQVSSSTSFPASPRSS